MRAEPGDEKAAGAVGHGHFRASHADREQVIGTLKAAFVQGRLAKDEFDLRVGQTLASRTYAELAALTADLPAGPADAVPPGRAARAHARQPVSNAAKAGIWVVIAVSVPMVLSFLSGGDVLFLLLTPFYFMALAFLGAEIVAARLKTRSLRGQPPRGPAPDLGRQASPRLSSPGPGGQLPPSDPGHRHAAEAARRHLPARPRWFAGTAPGDTLAAGTAPASG